MMFKIVLSDPKSRKAYQKEIEIEKSGLVNRKIGDKISADFISLSGYELQITGGSDKDGFPMRSDVNGIGRKKILVSSGSGFKPKLKGQRKRKSIRGNTISEAISQINLKVIKHGTKPIEEVFGVKKKEEEKKPEKESKKPAEKPAASEVKPNPS